MYAPNLNYHSGSMLQNVFIGRAMYICYVRVSRPAYISSVYSCVLRFMGAYPCCYIEKRNHSSVNAPRLYLDAKSRRAKE